MPQIETLEKGLVPFGMTQAKVGTDLVPKMAEQTLQIYSKSNVVKIRSCF